MVAAVNNQRIAELTDQIAAKQDWRGRELRRAQTYLDQGKRAPSGPWRDVLCKYSECCDTRAEALQNMIDSLQDELAQLETCRE